MKKILIFLTCSLFSSKAFSVCEVELARFHTLQSKAQNSHNNAGMILYSNLSNRSSKLQMVEAFKQQSTQYNREAQIAWVEYNTCLAKKKKVNP